MDSPYTVEYGHGNSVYLTIPASQRNGSQTNHYLSPGQYEVITSYQGDEKLTVQLLFNGYLDGNLVSTPEPTLLRNAEQSDPVTIVVKDGSNAGLRVYTTPRTSELADTSGTASLLIIPLPRYGDS